MKIATLIIYIILASTACLGQAREIIPQGWATQYRLTTIAKLDVDHNRLAVVADDIHITIRGITTSHRVNSMYRDAKEIIYLFEGGFLHIKFQNRKRVAYYFRQSSKFYDIVTEEDWKNHLLEYERPGRSL